MSKTSLTIIDDGKLRGVVAPARIVSKETLEDIIDLLEWSTPEAVKETEARVKKADRENSWIPAKKVEKKLRLRARVKALR